MPNLINDVLEIGNVLRKNKHSQNFRQIYSELSKEKPLEDFFYFNKGIAFQFDGFIILKEQLSISQEITSKTVFQSFIAYCVSFSYFLNMIVNMLNDSHDITRLYFTYDEFKGLDKENLIDDKFISMFFNEDSELIKNLLINLKTNFNDLNLIKRLYADGESETEEIKLNLQSLFFIIKQILYQFIIDDSLKSISSEENIMKISEESSIEGYNYKIVYAPTNNLNFDINPFDIIKLFLNEKVEYGFVNEIKVSFTQEKGMVSKIQAERLIETGIELDSPTNQIIDLHLTGKRI